jgi:methyl-accepting chemotaxis protein
MGNFRVSDIEGSTSRLGFMGMDSAAIGALQEITTVIDRSIGPALEGFYKQVRATPETMRFFSGEQHIAGAQGRQQGHWNRIARGSFDADYVDAVKQIGRIHARIGLEPRWYIGGYALVAESLIHAVVASHDGASLLRKSGRERLARQIAALVKAMLLDMDYSISVYQETADEEIIGKIGIGLEQLAQGNLAHRIDGVTHRFAKLQDDFNAAAGTLEEALTQVAQVTGLIQGTVQEVSEASDDLSRRTEQQAATLEETAAAMTEITATVQNSAVRANDANRLVQNAHGDARERSKVVADAVAAMGEIEKSAREITKIIEVIDKIAFQTNLLALNASVEAAHAGEAGRAFAVVANEVRALAQRSAEAAQDIGHLISNSTKQVEGGVALVGEAGEALARIISSVDEISTRVTEIAMAADQQSTALAQVNTAITEMDKTTQQNAAMVEQSSAATKSLADEATGLSRLVGRFDTSAGTAAAVAGGPGKRPARRASGSGGARALQSRVAAAADDWNAF